MNGNQTVLEMSLSDSSVFRDFNKNAELNTFMATAIKNSLIIDKSYIEEQILQMKHTRLSPLVDDVLTAYNNNDITLLYFNGTRKIPQMTPFFATKIQGKIRVFIFMNNYSTISKADVGTGEKHLNIEMKKLYALMEGGYTAFSYAKNPLKINKSLSIMKTTCSIYVQLLSRVLNKIHAISLDQQLYNTITFILGRFYLERVYMSTNEDIIFSYAKGNINNAVAISDLIQDNESYKAANVKTIEDLINYIQGLNPRFKDLTYRYFLQQYINTYHAEATFALESLPYFLFMIESSMLGSYIVNSDLVRDVTKNTKGMNMFYPELVKALN